MLGRPTELSVAGPLADEGLGQLSDWMGVFRVCQVRVGPGQNAVHDYEGTPSDSTACLLPIIFIDLYKLKCVLVQPHLMASHTDNRQYIEKPSCYSCTESLIASSTLL